MITITNGHTVPVMLVAGMWVQVSLIPRPLPPQLLITYSMGGRSGRVSHVIYTDTDITESVETFPTCYSEAKETGQAPDEREDLPLKQIQKI